MTYSPKEREILDQVVAALHGHYGERLSRVVLFGEAAYECRKALECGGLTPLFLPSRETSEFRESSQAKQRLTFHRSSKPAAPKVKAVSSHRTPKAGAKLGDRSAIRSAKVVSDFSRPNRRQENQATLRKNLAASLSEPRSGGICLRLSHGSAAVTKTRSANYRCARPRRNLALRAIRDGGKNAAAPWLVTLAN